MTVYLSFLKLNSVLLKFNDIVINFMKKCHYHSTTTSATGIGLTPTSTRVTKTKSPSAKYSFYSIHVLGITITNSITSITQFYCEYLT